MNTSSLPHFVAPICALLIASLAHVSFAAAPPAPSPEEQVKRFHLPPGFEIQLVLSDPDIGQPMNLNFDARGRLWVTSSIEYPYPADGPGVQPRPDRFSTDEKHPPRDWVAVVDGFHENGRAKKITRFASGLNIPIGQTPIGNGDEAIVYSIPNIDLLVDHDGDGVADERTKLYGTVGNVDTHGMINSFTPWIDGWIYGCHGFSNQSEITDGAGNVTRMRSGNTYRFRSDGSKFEQFTYGQVNPFGLTFDPLGNLYDADCHTMPVYQLIRGGLYPHFGSKPDALGFGPTMINHNHGSTGICGPSYYSADHFPQDFRDNIFICNPVSQVIHRDKLKQFGSTYIVDTQPDMVTCEGPWFRPVDVIMGPDGALYIADFFNPIIGHYEAPLSHPDRDRTHGRVWRVIYTGNDPTAKPYQGTPDLTKLDQGALIAQLNNPNLFVRTKATNRLAEQFTETVAKALRDEMPKLTSIQTAHGIWAIERTAGLTNDELRTLARHADRLVRVHTIKILAERPEWTELEFDLARSALKDDDAFVVRAAVDALARHPDAGNWRPLLAAWKAALPADTHLVYALRLALREHFRTPSAVKSLDGQTWDADEKNKLVSMAKVSETADASRWLLLHAGSEGFDVEILQRVARQAAQLNDQAMLEAIIKLSEKQPSELQLEGLSEWTQAERESGRRPADNPLAAAWAKRIADQLAPSLNESRAWTVFDVSGKSRQADNPWQPRDRQRADGKTKRFLDSIVRGEKRTGILRSRTFALPAEVRFFMCGQDGLPGKPSTNTNLVQVCLADGTVIDKKLVPRNDTAPEYVIETKPHTGKPGYVEVVDGNSNDTYAWIAVQGFSPEVPPLSTAQDETRDQLLKVIRDYHLIDTADALEKGIARNDAVFEDRLDIAQTLLALGQAAPASQFLISAATDGKLNAKQRSQAIAALGSLGTDEAQQVLVGLLPTSAAAQQLEVALALSSNQKGIEALLASVQQGKASAYLLQDPKWKQQAEAVLKSEQLRKRVEELTANLPPRQAQEQAQVDRLLAAYRSSQGDAAAGKTSFEKRCAACHRIGSQGALIGPQLDGVGNRPLARILEDVLIPSRNVDAAFKTVLIQTVDGQVISGLPRREEGEILVLANAEGKEIRIAKDEIELRKDSPLSLMPGNFAEQIPQAELLGLVRYLQSQKAVKPTE